MNSVEEAPEWEALELTVDSRASATVVGEDMVKAVPAENARADVVYEGADGSQIPHLCEKKFSAVTECGLLRRMVAQVTEVNKALLSVSKIVNAGNRWCSTVAVVTSNTKPRASGCHSKSVKVFTRSIYGSLVTSRPLSEGGPEKGRKTLQRQSQP